MRHRARGLPWAPHVALLALIVGLAASNWLTVDWRASMFGAVLCAVLTTVAARHDRAVPAAVAGVVALALLGLGWGVVRLGATSTVELRHAQTVEVQALVETTAVPTRDLMRARVRVVQTLLPTGALPVGTRLFAELSQESEIPRPGATVRLIGVVRPASQIGDPGWWRRYLARQMVAGAMRVRRI